MTTRQRLAWLHPGAQDEPFPPLEQALTEPNGLLAAGGDLALPRLLEAYRQGIFPWFEAGQPILWWSPDPRAVLFIERLNIGRSLRKSLRKRRYRVSFDSAFNQVVKACAAPRRGASGTWITYGMYVAYTQLFEQGHAHSVEVWEDDHLVGGLYGVAVGRLFCGESMFTRA
ncbi:MAG: leucyl/phenylalanyl-tRNA--protein transferase, partial [Chromatiales bacterium]|nr:leucyl/phenylalanyl-tRNA--protein transferase [Chromatiales bacterium]